MGDKACLNGFLKFLEKRVGFTFDVHNFDHRIKLQKYVYLAKVFGWNNDYRYNIYIRGPYSSNLADDYHDLIDMDESLLPSMDFGSFRDLVMNKDTAWLEVAATLLYIHKSYKHHYTGKDLENKVIGRTFELKNTISRDIICKAFEDLRDEGLFRKDFS